MAKEKYTIWRKKVSQTSYWCRMLSADSKAQAVKLYERAVTAEWGSFILCDSAGKILRSVCRISSHNHGIES